jgi:inorganic triphosphatase YgiF
LSEEFELKLRMSPERLEQLRRSALLRSLARERAVTRRLVSTYFDTPDRALQRRGVALRIRQIGDRRVQTLKMPYGEGGAVHAHRELETDIDGDTPQIHRIADDELREFLSQPEISQSLQPVFNTEFERTAVPVKLFDSEIEVALDRGELGAGERRAALSEAELELKTGRRERLYELAIAFNEAIPVSLEAETKAARGYRLADGEGPGSHRADAVELAPDMTARAAFSAIAKSALRQLRLNEACALLGEDIEGVHQQRVAIRRLRALISAFKETITEETRSYLTHELKWLQAVLGPARDWDVFIDESLAQMQERLPEEASLPPLLAESRRQRTAAYEALRSAISGPRYTEFLLRMELWLTKGEWELKNAESGDPLDRPITEFVRPILDRRHKKLLKIGGKKARLKEAEYHDLRLEFKKMRYLSEFFSRLFAKKPVRRYLKSMTEAQDRLGSLNDSLVSRALLQQIEEPLKNSLGEGEGRRLGGLLLGWQAARIDRDLDHFEDVWRDFRKQKRYWRVRD